VNLEKPGMNLEKPGVTRNTLENTSPSFPRPPPHPQNKFLLVFQVPGKTRNTLEIPGKTRKNMEIPGNTWNRLE
jgi:hypothetical protein